VNKVIWIINQYASTPETGMGGRHYYLGRELAKLGFHVYLIASSSHHLLRSKPVVGDAFKVEVVSDRFFFVWTRMPAYSEPHSKMRVFNWFFFPWRIRKLGSVIPEAPSAILCSSPSLFSFLAARWLSKYFNSRLLFEVRDIWPLTLTEIGGHRRGHPLIRLMQWVEDIAYRDADVVISNLENAVQHMLERGLDERKFFWVPNGFSREEAERNSPLASEFIDKFPKDKFVIGYAGTLGVANALDTLIDAAKELTDVGDVVFVLVGAGKEAASLKSKVSDYGLKNVVFFEPVAKDQIYSVLELFDVCFIGWKAERLYRYGVAANKIPEYMYSGKPVLHAYAGGCDPIKRYGAGVVVEPENVSALVDGVLQLYRMPKEERMRLGKNGRDAALEHYEYGRLAGKLLKVFQ
jgi:glycosyltransferase involved in cell wall biosynthesis